MTAAPLAVSASLLALFLWRGRTPSRLFADALAVGLTLGAAVAVAFAPFELRTNPLHFSPQTLAFLFAGLPEEGVKLLGAAAFLQPHYLARDRRDVTFAAGALGLGFAALENLFYLANAGSGWAPLADARAWTATPFHVFTSLAAGFAVARWPALTPRLLAWLALAAIHGAYDFAVFAGPPGATPQAIFRAAAALGVDPDVALRGLMCVAEAMAAVLAGAAVIAVSRTPRAAARGGWARMLNGRTLGRLAGSFLTGFGVLALVGWALGAQILGSVDTFFRGATFLIQPLALGVMFLATLSPGPARTALRRRQIRAAVAGLAALAFAAACLWGPWPWRVLEAEGLARRADLFAAKSDYIRAIEGYGEALARDPSRTDILAKRAEAYATLNRYDAAFADLDAALRIAPDAVALYVTRADLDRRRNDPAAAARDLDKALKRQPGAAQLLALRAQARLEAGDPKAGEDIFAAHLKAPANATVRHISAAFDVDIGDLDAALRELNAALHDNPADAEGTFQRGRVWFYKGEWGRAGADFARAGTMPPYPALWRFLAEARLGRDGGAALRFGLTSGWPAPVARMLLGDLSPEDARAAAADNGERCEADFYYAMSRLPQDAAEASAARLQAVVEECPTGFIEHEGAKAELRRLAP